LCTRRSWTSVADLRLSHKGFPGNFRRHHPTLIWRVWQFERLALRSRLWLHARIVSGLIQIIGVINQVVNQIVNQVVIYFIVLIGYRPVGIRRLSSCAAGACAIAISTATATSTALFGSGNCRSGLWAEGRSLRGSVVACVATWCVIGRCVASRIA
jgi:hypothetical protein